MNFLGADMGIKRSLSEAEIAAIERINQYLPVERRKRKRLLRQARERARKAEIAARKREGSIREPTDKELRDAMSMLSNWQTTEAFVRSVDALGHQVPTEKLWGNRYKGLREAMTLVQLCKHHAEISAARLVRVGDDPPDAFVRLNDAEEESVEITEVQEEGRRRGDEYRRGGAATSVFVPSDQNDVRTGAVVAQLQKAVEAKAGKYDFKPYLLIYLNHSYDRKSEAQIQAAIAELRMKYADEFRGIFVVTDRTLL